MLVVVALGGNAILRRGEPMSVSSQRDAIATACVPLAQIAAKHDLVVSHGNGPQVGLLALQAASYDQVSEYPFDVLGAQTEGMLGYLIEQELGNQLGNDRPIATLVTRTVVDADDPAFVAPTKFVGPVYSAEEAQRVGTAHGWQMRVDGLSMRRVVPSPTPLRILETQPIQWILDHQGVVICAGGGGVPTTHDALTDTVVGVEAVIDKDLAVRSWPEISARTCSSSRPTSTASTPGGAPPISGSSHEHIPMPSIRQTSRPGRWGPRCVPRHSSPVSRTEPPSSVP